MSVVINHQEIIQRENARMAIRERRFSRTLMSMEYAPSGFVVEKPVGSLLVLIRDCLGLLVPLEPGLILLVEPPCLVLECLGGQILLVCPLLVVESIEEGIILHLASNRRVKRRVVDERQAILRPCYRRIPPRLRLMMPYRLRIRDIGCRISRCCYQPLRGQAEGCLGVRSRRCPGVHQVSQRRGQVVYRFFCCCFRGLHTVRHAISMSCCCCRISIQNLERVT